MKKGMTGKVVTIVISIVVAITALIVLWIILNRLMKGISIGITDIMFEIKCAFCDKMGILSKIERMCKACP